MADKNNGDKNRVTYEYRSDDLRKSPTMAHLLDSLEKGEDIGHYGRLTFTIVARHFMADDDIIKLLSKQPGVEEEEARARLVQVKARDYNPPRRERLLQWQKQQEYPICPTPEDPDSCNLYRELAFPDDIYEDIEEYWEDKVEAGDE